MDQALKKDAKGIGSRKLFPLSPKVKRQLKENLVLYAILSLVLIAIVVFCYVPLYGIVISFQNYYPGNAFLAFDGSVE